MSLVVRAVDVGYGHVKFTDGFDGESILAESFPSQSVVSSASQHQSKVWQQRDTFQIPIGDRLYEVGRDIRFAMTGTQETEVLDQDFALSDAYRARLYGALNYMRPRLPRQHIDFLVLGLPLTTYNKHSKALADLYTGPQTIGPNQVITIGECVVIEQPVGSYLTYLTDNRIDPGKAPTALVVDPGYNTVDWYVCEGLLANTAMSRAIERGMSAFIRAIAKSLGHDLAAAVPESELVRVVDLALKERQSSVRLFGKDIELAKHFEAGQHILDEAAQAIRNLVGAGAAIDVIILTGGGAYMYETAIANKFPGHTVMALNEPHLANVRGFQTFGESMAASAARANHAAGTIA